MKRPSPTIALLAATIAYMVLVLSLGSRTYWENDNVAILGDIRLGYSVSFMSVLLGKVLSFLYLNVSDAIPWYGLMLYAISGSALFLALWSINTLCRSPWLKYGFFALLLVCFSRFLVTVSYNAASIMIGFSCLLALMVHMRSTARLRPWIILGLGFLFSFSYLIRTSGVKAVLLFAAVAIGCEIAARFRTSLRGFALFMLPLVLLYGADVAVERYGVSDEYRSFQEWNTVRGKFHAYPVSSWNRGNPDVLEANNWEDAHYDMLLSWVFFDEDLYNIQTVQNITRYSVPLPSDGGVSPGRVAGELGDILGRYWLHWIVLAALIGFTVSRGRRSLVVLQIAQGLYFLGGSVAMATLLRFPERIALAMILGMMLLTYYFIFKDEIVPEAVTAERVPTDKRVVWAVTLILLGATCVEIPALGTRIGRERGRQEHYYRNLEVLRTLEPEFMLALSGPALGPQYRDPLRVHPDDLPFVPAGWGIFSPRFYGFLRGHGLERGADVIPRLVQRERTYVICGDKFMHLIKHFIQVNYGWKIRVEKAHELDETLHVYRIVIGSSRRGFTQPLEPGSARRSKKKPGDLFPTRPGASVREPTEPQVD